MQILTVLKTWKMVYDKKLLLLMVEITAEKYGFPNLA